MFQIVSLDFSSLHPSPSFSILCPSDLLSLQRQVRLVYLQPAEISMGAVPYCGGSFDCYFLILYASFMHLVSMWKQYGEVKLAVLGLSFRRFLPFCGVAKLVGVMRFIFKRHRQQF